MGGLFVFQARAKQQIFVRLKPASSGDRNMVGVKASLFGFHWPYPGVGFAERKDTAFQYVPVS